MNSLLRAHILMQSLNRIMQESERKLIRECLSPFSVFDGDHFVKSLKERIENSFQRNWDDPPT